MIRILDLLFSALGLLLLFPVLFLLFIIVYFDTGSPLFFQKRMGLNKQIFNLVKFRTMKLNSPSLPTHLVDESFITKFGSTLRKSKLDELPQLWNVLLGEMSFVGPRPNLINQKSLINYRDSLLIYSVRPGITGLSQLKNINMSTPFLLAKTDYNMIKDLNLINYFKYFYLTITYFINLNFFIKKKDNDNK